MKKLMSILICSMLLFTIGCNKDKEEPETPGSNTPDPTEPETGKTYAVGDYYNVDGVQGIVYKITDGGKHGMIISMDQGANLAWSSVNSATGATHATNGANNMTTIKNLEAEMDSYPVFKWCKNKNTGSITGWYLPSKNETLDISASYLKLQLALQENGGNIFHSNLVWSSTEIDEYIAFYIDMNNKRAEEGDKYMGAYFCVRAVKAF